MLGCGHLPPRSVQFLFQAGGVFALRTKRAALSVQLVLNLRRFPRVQLLDRRQLGPQRLHVPRSLRFGVSDFLGHRVDLSRGGVGRRCVVQRFVQPLTRRLQLLLQRRHLRLHAGFESALRLLHKNGGR